MPLLVPMVIAAPVTWLRGLLSPSVDLISPAASQSRQVSRFTCRSSPSAQDQQLAEPPPQAASPAEGSGAAPRGVYQCSPVLQSSYCCSLQGCRSDTVSSVPAHIRVGNTNEKMELQGTCIW